MEIWYLMIRPWQAVWHWRWSNDSNSRVPTYRIDCSKYLWLTAPAPPTHHDRLPTSRSCSHRITYLLDNKDFNENDRTSTATKPRWNRETAPVSINPVWIRGNIFILSRWPGSRDFTIGRPQSLLALVKKNRASAGPYLSRSSRR